MGSFGTRLEGHGCAGLGPYPGIHLDSGSALHLVDPGLTNPLREQNSRLKPVRTRSSPSGVRPYISPGQV